MYAFQDYYLLNFKLRLRLKIQQIFPYQYGNLEARQTYHDWHSFLAIQDAINFKKEPLTKLESLDQENLLKHLYIDYTYMAASDSNDKKLTTKLRQMVKDKQAIIPKNKSEKAYEMQLQRESKRLDDMIKYFNHDDDRQSEIDRQLRMRMRQLDQINVQNHQKVKDLSDKVNVEVRHKSVIYFVNSVEDARRQDFRNRVNLENALISVRMANNVDDQLIMLRQLILRLDKKQVAESISKIVGCQKPRGADTRFKVVFEQALNLSPHVFPEQTLHELNDLREYSLLKFYNVSLKSLYSNISHVISGFGHIYKRRNQQNLIKGKDLLEILKKNKQSEEINSRFADFEICHHCKQLYDKNILVGCSYRSSKMGVPIITPSYADPYVQQIIDNDGNAITNRNFVNRKKNNFMTYSKRGNEYVCLRRYCRTCLKQSYDSIDKNGLCAFCQGVCFCTRCLRNDMITKLKTIYNQLGGDVGDLHQESLFEKLVSKSTAEEVDKEEIEVVSSRRRSSQKKGRPKKPMPSRVKSSIRVYNHMKDLREQMEQFRLICHLVKRRQTQKLKLFDKKYEVFRLKIGQLDEEQDILRKLNVDKESPNDHSKETGLQSSDQEHENHKVNENFKKKLRKLK